MIDQLESLITILELSLEPESNVTFCNYLTNAHSDKGEMGCYGVACSECIFLSSATTRATVEKLKEHLPSIKMRENLLGDRDER